jgi:hypothetical protein
MSRIPDRPGPEQPGRTVSLKPSDYVPEPLDPHESLRDYPLSAKREDRLTVNLARPQRQALSILESSERVHAVQLFCWVAWRGLATIETIPAVVASLGAHKAVERAGGDLEPFERWAFRPDWDGLTRVSMNNVPPDLAGKCHHVAEGLGLPGAVMYGLAIAFGMIGQTLPTTVSEQLADHVVTFKQAMRKRAKKLTALAASVGPADLQIYEEPEA